MKKNKFSKALKHIKKDLNEVAPTNNMSGIYSLNDPGYSLRHPSGPKTFRTDKDGNFPSGIPGTPGSPYIRPGGIWTGEQDWDEIVPADFSHDLQGADGNSTDGLIGENGVVYSDLPPGSRSYILGPLVDGFVRNHAYDAYTRIGYIQKDTRQFVLLAKIFGTWKEGFVLETGAYRYESGTYNYPVWDGTTVHASTGFHTYGSFTLADAQWMRAEILAGKYVKNAVYRNSGGIQQTWNYYASLPGLGIFYNGVGVGAGSGDAADNGLGGGGGYGQGGDPTVGTQQTDPPKKGNAEDAGFPWFPFGPLGKKAKDLWDNITDNLGDIKDNMEEFFNDAFDDSVQGAKDFRDSLQNALDSARDATSNVEDTTWAKLGGSMVRSIMDPITYAGDIVFKGLPSGTPYDAGFKGGGPKWAGGKKITDMLGGFLGKDVQYFTPDLDTAIKYAGEGGNVVAMPRPKDGVRGFKNWFGSTVSRGFDPTKGVEQIVKTSDSVAAKNLTKIINLSDEGAAETLKALAAKGATNNKLLAKLGKAVPFLNAGLVAADVSNRLAKGDYLGALMGGMQIIPGPVGWTMLGAQLAYDVTGTKNTIPWNEPGGINVTTSNAKSAIENIVSNASQSTSQNLTKVTNDTIDTLVSAAANSQILPAEDQTAGKLFLKYLTGTAPKNAGDLVPPKEQEDAWKQMKFNKGGGITVHGPMQNVFGGESADSLTVDKDGNAVLEFEFAPKTNKVEFAGAPERWSTGYKDFITKFEPLTQYAADLTPDFGKTKGSKKLGLAAGAATNVFKQIDKLTPDGSILGGIKTARDLEGNIKIPMSKLKTLNPDAYEILKSKQNTSSKWMPKKDVKVADNSSTQLSNTMGGGLSVGGKIGIGGNKERSFGVNYGKGDWGNGNIFNWDNNQKPGEIPSETERDAKTKTNLDKELERLKLSKKGKNKSKMRVTHYEPQGEFIKESYGFYAPLSEDKTSDDSSISDNMGAALIEMGLPKDKKDFIKEMGFHLMLQDQVDPNLQSMILKALQGEELSSEQKKWMDKNFQPMIDAVANRNSDNVKESFKGSGLRRVKFVMEDVAAAPAPTTPTNQTTTQQPTESKETADALAQEYIEKNGPEKTKELIDKTDEYLSAHGQDPEHHNVEPDDFKNLTGEQKIAKSDKFIADYMKTFEDDTHTTASSIKLLDNAIKYNPKNINSYWYRSFAYFDGGNYVDALKDIEKILEVDPDNKDVYYVKSMIYQEKGDLELALDELEKAIEARPDIEYFKSKKTDLEGQIQQEYREKQVPPDANEEGGVVKRAKYYDDVSEKLTPDDTDNQQQISSNLTKAIDLMTSTHYNRGRTGYGSKGAVDLLQEILPLDPNNPEILSNLGVAMLMSGKYSSKEALEHLEKAQALDPSIDIDFDINTWDRYDGGETQPYAGAKIDKLSGLPYRYAREIIKNLPDQSKAIGGKYGAVENYTSRSTEYSANAKAMSTETLQIKLVEAARNIETNKYWMSRGYDTGNTSGGGRGRAYNISMNQVFGFMQAGMEGEYTGAVPQDVSKKLEDANKKFKETSNKWNRILNNPNDPAYDAAVAWAREGGWKDDPDYRYTEDHKHIPGARQAALRLNAQVKGDVEEYQAYYNEYMARGGEEPIGQIDLPKEGTFVETAQKEIIEKAISEPAKLFNLDTEKAKIYNDVMSENLGANSIGYVASLPFALGTSILTGKPMQMFIDPSSAIKIAQDINADELANVLRIDNPVPVTAREAIEPSKGKSDKVLTTLFGKQGGLYYNYDTETKQLYIESRKTLRTTSGGESVDGFRGDLAGDILFQLPNMTGTGTKFTDIPVPSNEKINELGAGIIWKALSQYSVYKDFVDPVVKTPGLLRPIKILNTIWDGLTGKIKTKDEMRSDAPRTIWNEQAGKMMNMYDFGVTGLKEVFDENLISDMVTKAASGFVSTSVNAIAANLIAVRSILTDLGVPASDIEKFGGAYGMTYSSTPVNYNDLPDEVKAVIDAAVGTPQGQSKVSGTVGKLGDLSATDAASLAGERKKKKNNQVSVEVYKPKGRRLQESDLNLSRRKVRMLKEIKKPVLVEELPQQKLRKYKPNFKGKYSPQNTPDKTASKESDALVMAGNQKGQTWRTQDKYWSGYETQERMNIIQDRVGHGEMAWDMIVDEARRKNGWKNREIQEQLNQIAAEKGMKEQVPDYESPFGYVIHEQGASTEEELDTVMKDPAVKVKHPFVKNLAKRLKGQIDYKDKPSRQGFPDEPPAKQQDGWHPEYGKKYKYDKLDPQSAEAMPPTGNPEIDANVEKAKPKKPRWKHINTESKVDPKVKWQESVDWRNEIEIPEKKEELVEEKKSLFRKIRQIELDEAIANSTSGVLSGAKHIPGAGDVDLQVLQTGLTGDGGIDYGDDGYDSAGSGNSTHTGVGEYTGITNLEPISTAPDPTNVGTRLRVVDFFNGLQSSGSLDLHMKNIPGYKGADIGTRIAVSGRKYAHINDPEYGKHGGVHEYTIDELGKTYPSYNNTDGLTDRGHGTALIFKEHGHWGAFKPVDTSEMDTIKLRARVHQNSISDASFGVQLYYWAGDKPGFQSLAIDDPVYDGEASRPNDGWRPIYQKPDGTIDDTVSHIIIPDRTQRPAENHNVLADYSQQIPEWCRSKATRFLLFSKGANAGGSASFALTSVRFQRRNSITVGAPLDSPEASSFVRVGQGSADTTPEQRKKRVEEMLKASRLYMLKILGYNDFPGMGATLDTVASSPISFSDVWNIHAKSLGNKERQAFRRAVSDRSQNYSYRSSSKSQNYFYKVTSKDSRGLTKTATVRTPESVAEYERRQRWRSQNRK